MREAPFIWSGVLSAIEIPSTRLTPQETTGRREKPGVQGGGRDGGGEGTRPSFAVRNNLYAKYVRAFFTQSLKIR